MINYVRGKNIKIARQMKFTVKLAKRYENGN